MAGKIAFVCPGQGAQVVGMGRDLYENSAAARQVFATVDEACGFAVSVVAFDGPEDALKDTRNTQPALYAVSVAAIAALREAGIYASATAGHSSGEYAALVAAGSLSVEEGARLVSLRAQAMAQAAQHNAGGMAAVLGLDPQVIGELCAQVNPVGVVVIANLNSPQQTVISGELTALEAVEPLLKARGAKRVVPLAVSGAFHSPLMSRAADHLRPLLASAEIADPVVPIVANVTGDYETTAEEVRHNLAAQVSGQVRWVETINRLVADGCTTFIECGPGNVLAGLIKRIAPDAVTYSVGDTKSLAIARQALGAAS